MTLEKYTLFIFLLAHSFGFSQFEEKLERIKQLTSEVMEKEDIPAISIGIVTDTNEVHFVNFGHFDRSQEQEVDSNSIYQIGSLSKTFVGLVVHNLILEGVIHKDSSVASVLPLDFPKRRLKKLQNITVEDLLTHRSGFSRDARAGYKRKDGDPYNYEYTVADMQKDLRRLRLRSKKNYRYSNFAYALLGYISELATGKTYSELLEKYVYQPYLLGNTTLNLNDQQISKLVTPYRKDNRSAETEPWVMGKLCPPSAIYSNTVDLTTLMIAQIKAYSAYLRGQEVTAPVLTHNKREVAEGSGVSYGYGCFVWGSTIGHGGDIDGYSADYSFHPKQHCGVVLLTSSGGKWINPLIIKINRILLEESAQ